MDSGLHFFFHPSFGSQRNKSTWKPFITQCFCACSVVIMILYSIAVLSLFPYPPTKKQTNKHTLAIHHTTQWHSCYEQKHILLESCVTSLSGFCAASCYNAGIRHYKDQSVQHFSPTAYSQKLEFRSRWLTTLEKTYQCTNHYHLSIESVHPVLIPLSFSVCVCFVVYAIIRYGSCLTVLQ